MTKTANIRTQFERGNYREILEATLDSAGGACPVEDMHYLIGSLCFRGRADEAVTLFERHRGALPLYDVIRSRFYLGIGFCRHSRYADARAYFAANLRDGRRGADARSRFFVAQGIGFYRYFCGRFSVALRASHTAMTASQSGRFLYGKALASDLMAHCLVQTGHVQSGMARLEEAIRYAKLLGNGSLAQSFEISASVYRAQFGLTASAALEHLTRFHEGLSPQDSYSKAGLLMELGRQLALRGRADEARTALNEACPLVYGFQHRRYSAILSLRYAWLALRSGEPHQALHLARTSAASLDARVDQALEIEARGLEHMLGSKLKLTDEKQRLAKRIAELTLRTGKGSAHRMLRRAKREPTNALPGEDLLGDLMDRIALSPEGALEEILESGYFGLLHEALGVEPGKPTLFFDLIPGGLAIFDRGNVRFHASGVSKGLKQLARMLGTGDVTKPDLIREVWGYDYHPLRHDALIYRAVSRLRQLLGDYAYWIEGEEGTYRLRAGVDVRFPTGPAPVTRAALGPEDQAELNHRQMLILRWLKGDEFIDVPGCSARFEVSEMTARRDLVDLCKKALVRRIGKARATRYTRLGCESSEESPS